MTTYGREKRVKSQNGNKYAPWFSSSLVRDHKGSFFTLPWDQWDQDWFLDLPAFVILTIHSVIWEIQKTAEIAVASDFQTFKRPEMPLYELTRDMLCWNILSVVCCYQMHFFFKQSCFNSNFCPLLKNGHGVGRCREAQAEQGCKPAVNCSYLPKNL